MECAPSPYKCGARFAVTRRNANDLQRGSNVRIQLQGVIRQPDSCSPCQIFQVWSLAGVDNLANVKVSHKSADESFDRRSLRAAWLPVLPARLPKRSRPLLIDDVATTHATSRMTTVHVLPSTHSYKQQNRRYRKGKTGCMASCSRYTC